MNTWIKLDNAGIVFPSVAKANNSSIFRIAMILTEPVQANILQKALDKTLRRYPLMTLCIRKGLFWRYMEKSSQPILIQKEEEYPCAPMRQPLNQEPLIKVLYYNQRIAIEVFHATTDGAGGVEFLKTLVFEYLRLTGKQLMPEGLILTAGEPSTPEEAEDGFHRYYVKGRTRPLKHTKAYQIEGNPFEPFGHHVIHGVLSASQLNKIAKQHDATITEFVLALLIWTIDRSNPKVKHKPITVSVPINLRRFFPTKSLRNFFTVTSVSVNVKKEDTLLEIIHCVQQQMKENVHHSRLQEAINRNINFEKILIARFIPLIVKDLIVRSLFFYYNDKLRTCTVSNLGKVQLPQSMAAYIDRMELVFYPTLNNPVNCGICAVNDQITITFARTIMEEKIIGDFFRRLAKEYGLEIKIYSNEWGNWN